MTKWGSQVGNWVDGISGPHFHHSLDPHPLVMWSCISLQSKLPPPWTWACPLAVKTSWKLEMCVHDWAWPLVLLPVSSGEYTPGSLLVQGGWEALGANLIQSAAWSLVQPRLANPKPTFTHRQNMCLLSQAISGWLVTQRRCGEYTLQGRPW